MAARLGGNPYGVVVVGAGAFGAWTAYQMRRSGRTVLMLDGYGAGNSRSSSGGETRALRLGYGPDVLMTQWARRSLELWKDFFRHAGQSLFDQTGILWLGRPHDEHLEGTEETFRTLGIRHQRIGLDGLAEHFPQVSPDGLDSALIEPDGGVLMARRAVRLLVQETLKLGGVIRADAAEAPTGGGTLAALLTSAGDEVRGEHYVFACGPWMPQLFPELLADRMHVTRQEVYFFGTQKGDPRFAPPQLPVWMDFGDAVYGIPDLQRRGLKVAFDRHGPAFDPDLDDRLASPRGIAEVRTFVSRRFPLLAHAPLLEARVCQYCNTSNADFLIARHPSFNNVWLLGGGSGHGFKHAPAIAQHLLNHIEGKDALHERFSLETKTSVQQRLVF